MSFKILDLDPNNYKKHRIHGEGRDWAETNCYMDVWIELLHSMGHEPIAALPCVFAIDFEGDQWTFFKYSLADIDSLFGLDVQELNIWQDLLSCIEEQLEQKRPVLVELDSFFLPDTLGTAYKIDHVKSTVAVNSIDRVNKTMGYFHNQGYHALQGDDFEQLFLATLSDRVLPPYVEYVKKRQRAPLTPAELLNKSLDGLRFQLQNLPVKNPFLAFKKRFLSDYNQSKFTDIEYFHKYSFATLRQYGAAFELCKTYLCWVDMQSSDVSGLSEAIQAYGKISESSKVLQFQLARAISRKKVMNLALIDEAAENWQKAVNCLKQHYL